jgi:hypothetical protein
LSSRNNVGQGLNKDSGLTARSQRPRIRSQVGFSRVTKDFVLMLCHISCRAVQPSQPSFELLWLNLAQGLITCEIKRVPATAAFVSNLSLEDLQQDIVRRRSNVVGPEVH